MSLPLNTIASRLMTVPGFTFARTQERVERMVGDGLASQDTILAVIEGDPVINAMVLGQAASSGRPVIGLRPALASIGLGALQGLVKDMEPIPEDRQRAFATCWSASMACAVLLPRLAAHIRAARTELVLPRDADNDQALFALGLLQDLGTLVAMRSFPKEYQRASDRLMVEPLPFDELLRQELGARTGDLGYLIARAWSLPPTVAAVLRHHHRPAGAELPMQQLCALVHVGRSLSRACGHVGGGQRYLEVIDDASCALLRLNLSEVGGLLDEFLDDLEERELNDISS